MGGANVASQNKLLFHLRIIFFIIGIIKINFADAFVRGDSVKILYCVVYFVELFFMIESIIEDTDHFEVLLQVSDFFCEKFETLNHHVLSQNHHDFVLELFADDHVPDGS